MVVQNEYPNDDLPSSAATSWLQLHFLPPQPLQNIRALPAFTLFPNRIILDMDFESICDIYLGYIGEQPTTIQSVSYNGSRRRKKQKWYYLTNSTTNKINKELLILMLPLTISVGHKVDKTIETSICDFRYTASTATYGLDGCCCKVLVRTGNIGLQLKGNEQRWLWDE